MSTLHISEAVTVPASPDAVFRFLLDPEKVVLCLPGASYDGLDEDGSFRGSIKVKVGPVATHFRGRATIDEVDEGARRLRLMGDGKDQSGSGSARMTMIGQVTPTADGGARLSVEADVELAGRIVSFGRGMMNAVSAQLFKQFSERIQTALTTPAPEPLTGAPAPAAPGEPAAPREESLNAVGLLFSALWASVKNFFRRLFGRSR